MKEWKAMLEWGHERGRQAGRETRGKREAREKRHERELSSGGSFKGCTPRTGNGRLQNCFGGRGRLLP